MKRAIANRDDASSDPSTSHDMKINLSKKIKAALLTLRAFTEEQVDAIVNETSINLPSDF